MKKLSLLFLLLLISCYAGRSTFIETDSLDDQNYIKKYFKIEDDDFSDAVTYSPKFYSLTSNRVEFLVSTTINKFGERVPLLIMKVKYKGNGWIFYDEIVFNIDDKLFKVKPMNVNRNVISGSTVEEISLSPTISFPDGLLEAFSKAENIKMQLIGDKYKTRKLEDKEVEAIKNSIVFHNYLLKKSGH